MRILGFAVMGLVSFVGAFLLALHLHFPGEMARDRLAWELQEASKGAWLMQAADAHPYGLTGLSLEDAVLFKVEKARGRKTPDSPPPAASPVLRLDSLGVRALLFPLLRGEKAAGYRAELYGGLLQGEVGLKGTDRRLEIHGKDLDLSRIPLEGEEWSIDAGGMLRIDGELTLRTEDIKQSEGTLELSIEDLVFKEAAIMGMTLQPTPFTEAVLRFEVEEGKARVDKGSFKSEPVEITVTGDIILNKDPMKSRLKLALEVRLAEEFDRLAKMAPNLKAARDEDGLYHFRVSGTLDSPRFKEERQSKRGRATPARPRNPGGEEDDPLIDAPLIDDPDMDAEARREARRERIKERRKKMLDRRNENGLPEAGAPPPDDIGMDLPPGEDPGPGDRPDEVEMLLPEDMGQQDIGPLDGDEPMPEADPMDGEY